MANRQSWVLYPFRKAHWNFNNSFKTFWNFYYQLDARFFFYIFWPKNLTLWVPNLLVLIHLIMMLLCLTLGFSLDVNILYMYGGLISFRVLNILTANVHNLLISMVILLLLQKQPPEVFYHKRCSSKFGKIHRKIPAPEPLF